MTVAQRSSAAGILAKKGQAVTLTYPGGSTYNPATSSTSGAAPDPETVMGAILPFSPFQKASGNVVEGSQQLLLSALNTDGSTIAEPPVNGTVTDANAKDWTLTKVEPLAPAGLPILYDCIIRRAA